MKNSGASRVEQRGVASVGLTGGFLCTGGVRAVVEREIG
jgi:hypothetical protein